MGHSIDFEIRIDEVCWHLLFERARLYEGPNTKFINLTTFFILSKEVARYLWRINLADMLRGALCLALILQCAQAEDHNSVEEILNRIEDYADTLGRGHVDLSNCILPTTLMNDKGRYKCTVRKCCNHKHGKILRH